MDYTVLFSADFGTFHYTSHMTFTGLIGKICMFPLRAIISACVALKIHPNILTFVGVVINVWAAVYLARGEFSKFGGFWDSVIDRFSDIALFIGLIYLYSDNGRTDYALIASLAMMFTI